MNPTLGFIGAIKNKRNRLESESFMWKVSNLEFRAFTSGISMNCVVFRSINSRQDGLCHSRHKEKETTLAYRLGASMVPVVTLLHFDYL